jgi:hypothetical protein
MIPKNHLKKFSFWLREHRNICKNFSENKNFHVVHIVQKGGAGTGAAAWYGAGSSKMLLLWLRFGRLQLTLFINIMLIFDCPTGNQSSIILLEPEPYYVAAPGLAPPL